MKKQSGDHRPNKNGQAQSDRLRRIKYFLLDMDGTIYLDTTLIDGTLHFLDTLRTQGKRALYITNNSSKAVVQYIEKLKMLGISASADDFYTSANALVYNLKKQAPGARIFLLGTPALEEYLCQNGFQLVKEYTEDPQARPAFVVLAYDTTLTYDKLRIACDYLTDGVTYWATHPDQVCPVGVGRSVPDAGAFMACIEVATGRRPSFVAGKPNPCIIHMVMEATGCSAEEIAVVGDRLNPDSVSAVNAGVTSVCVLTGETSADMIKKSDIQPDFVFHSIKDLWEILR